jgi:orotate phosphoribosyltransferase-like protein
MALRKRRIASIDGLSDLLNAKVATSAIMGTKADVEASNSTTTVVSSAAVNEIVTDINNSISNIQSGLDGIIDDAAGTGNTVTWSIDKIKEYVASVDDSIVVSDISERDNLSTVYDSLIAYVLDTTGDSSLGDNEGAPAAYIYVDGTGWALLQILSADIDLTPYVKTADIVDDLTTGGSTVPASAETVKTLKSELDNFSTSVATEIKVDSGLTISGDDFTTTYTPIGDIIGMTAEVETSSGVYDVVDITAGANAKEYSLVTSTSGEYDGKTCRVTYIKLSSES